MNKPDALKLFGGTPAKTARALGLTPQAVSLWPDVLPDATRDRVLGACTRLRIKIPKELMTPEALKPTPKGEPK